MSRGGAERKRERHRMQSRLQALSCQPTPETGVELMNHEIMTWAGQTLNRLSHPAPLMFLYAYLYLKITSIILFHLAVILTMKKFILLQFSCVSKKIKSQNEKKLSYFYICKMFLHMSQYKNLSADD